ncbi:MAG: hypothetical protein RL030_479 [Pseudomonadota bacterium]
MAPWAAAAAVAPDQVKDSSESANQYRTVQAAWDALKDKPGVTIRLDNAWTVIGDQAALTTWSFAPKGHPAYPAVVRRVVVSRNGDTAIEVSVLCEASKDACVKLLAEFQGMTDRAFSPKPDGGQ